MEEKSFPLIIWIYKGEERLLFIPIIEHMYGYSIASDKFYRLDDIDSASKLGDIIIDAIDYIKNCPLSVLTPKEREANAAWKKNTKYKSKLSFWKNNHFAEVQISKNGDYKIYSMTKSEKEKGSYEDIIKKIDLSETATTNEIGTAVLEVLRASEKYYEDFKPSSRGKNKEIELMDTTRLTFKVPSEPEWKDCADSGAVEIYQCYRYITKAEEEVSVLYLGIASELDCNLSPQNIQKTWLEMYGASEYFDVQEIPNGIFSRRAEIKNNNMHKISYFKQMEDDLLLECSVELYQPNKRKKLDEILTKEFEEFSATCKFV